MKTPILFVKFGQKEHIEELQNEGVLYLNTVEFFKNLESEQGTRGDLLEGASELKNFFKDDKAILTISPGEKEEIKINLTKAQFRQFQSYQGNIFSLYSILNNEKKVLEVEFEESMKSFGDTALIITNVNNFLARVQNELQKMNLKFKCGVVDYYNSKERNVKNLNIFKKSSDFQNQNEFRIFVENPINEPLKIRIGSISKISTVVKSEKLTKLKIETIKT